MIFATTFFMSQGARNCPFFTLTARPVCAAATRRSVWRQRKAGNLQDIDRCGNGGALRGLMHIGEHRQADALTDFGEDGHRAPSSPRPRCAVGGCAVGLVEACLVDEADARACRDLLERGRHLERMGAAFELAGARDQGQRQRIAEGVGDATEPILTVELGCIGVIDTV